MKKDMHDNSLTAWAEWDIEKLGKRQTMIIGYLRMNGAATDREIAHGLGFAERNAVSPRITEMMTAGNDGIIVEIGRRDNQRIVDLNPRLRKPAQKRFCEVGREDGIVRMV